MNYSTTPNPPEMTMSADVERLLQPFDISEDDRELLRQMWHHAPPEKGHRAVILAVSGPVLEELAPAAIGPYERYLEQFPPTAPFSYIPVRDLVMLAAYPGHLIWPELPIEDATNRLVASCAQHLSRLSLYQPLFAACEDKLDRFLDVAARSHRLVFNHGEISHHHERDDLSVVRFDGQPALAMRLILPGFFAGLLDALSIDGTVTFDYIHATCAEVEVRWD